MSQQSTYTVESWEEDEIFSENGRKIVTAKVTQKYSGYIEGSSQVEFVMCYLDESRASFVGIEIVNGKVDGKQGTFVIRHVGEYSGGLAKSTWAVVEASGTEGLASIAGFGSYEAAGREVVTQHELKL